jgi:membrane protein implicated in regulation of membrane protease activity
VVTWALDGRTKTMEQLVWIAWLVIGIGLIIAEVFTLSFFMLWFGIGALAAALAAMFGAPFILQFAIFAIVSVALTAMSRTIFAKYLSHDDENTLKMGIDALPGQIGTVTDASRGALHEGAVKVYGSTWTAFPIDGETMLEEGEKVEVVSIKGSSIYVRPVKRELPGWRSE